MIDAGVHSIGSYCAKAAFKLPSSELLQVNTNLDRQRGPTSVKDSPVRGCRLSLQYAGRGHLNDISEDNVGFGDNLPTDPQKGWIQMTSKISKRIHRPHAT